MRPLVPPPRIADIQAAVCERFNLRLDNLVGARRFKSYSRPRQIGYYVAGRMTTRSTVAIGLLFGGRDHSTVIHGVKRMKALRVDDHDLSGDLDWVEQRARLIVAERAFPVGGSR